MEEAQARDPQPAELDAEVPPALVPRASLNLRYCVHRDLVDCDPDTVLGGLAFGSQPPPQSPVSDRVVWVQTPVLSADDFSAIWTSETPVIPVRAHGLAGAHNGHVLFGALQLPEDAALNALSELAYQRVFDFVDELGYPYLWRTWNYLSAINAEVAGTERYRRFNEGRHAAFASRGRVIGQNTPAACALGSRSGPLTVCFLAGRGPGRAIENPRQVSAYRYPPAYGARSPTFSRAMLLDSGSQTALLISGTSSIVGHESLHAGDVSAQVKETIRNIEAVVGEAGWTLRRVREARAKLLLTVYTRRRSDVRAIQEALAEVLSAPAEIVYVEADVCRSELLVEIEAALFATVIPSLH